MRKIRVKRLANKTIFYQLIESMNNTEELLLEGSMYCPSCDCTSLFVTDFLTPEGCSFIKDDGYLELSIHGYLKLLNKNIHESYNKALEMIRTSILKLYNNLID